MNFEMLMPMFQTRVQILNNVISCWWRTEGIYIYTCMHIHINMCLFCSLNYPLVLFFFFVCVWFCFFFWSCLVFCFKPNTELSVNVSGKNSSETSWLS